MSQIHKWDRPPYCELSIWWCHLYSCVKPGHCGVDFHALMSGQRCQLLTRILSLYVEWMVIRWRLRCTTLTCRWDTFVSGGATFSLLSLHSFLLVFLWKDQALGHCNDVQIFVKYYLKGKCLWCFIWAVFYSPGAGAGAGTVWMGGLCSTPWSCLGFAVKRYHVVVNFLHHLH